MKNRSFFYFSFILILFSLVGCSTTPKKRYIPYTLGRNEGINGTAVINFSDYVAFVNLEGEQLPDPDEGTGWFPLQFPAGRELKIMVSYRHSNLEDRSIFICPPLEAGKSYKLWYESNKRRFTLTLDSVKKLGYLFGNYDMPMFTAIHVQQVPFETPYTFANNRSANGYASIVFDDRIRIVDYNGESLPAADEGTRWYPLRFPAGRALDIRMYVVYLADVAGYRRRGVFECPPLEAGKSYKLWYVPADRNFYSGAGKLILTYDDVKELKYFLGIPSYNQIYVQDIPAL